ncbi:MAG: dihydroorotate dehydrogenase electron transfer subunit, partial [Dehalococcoidia bacterium]|nr:dihydroorotate dehydrogenase electron transfer subunit [Dehalococcoidia bacterium]
MRQILVPITSNEEIMPGIHLLWIEAPQIAGAAQPGQFVMVRTSEDHDPLLRRPLSIHRVGENGALALLFEVVGRGTEWLAQRKAG